MSDILIRSSETTIMGLTDEHEIAFRINKSNWKGELYKNEYGKVMESTIELMKPTGDMI